MRNICARAVGVALFVGVVAPVAAQRPTFKVTLLGTGCPPAVMNRFGPSTLVEAGQHKFLVDAGRGALQRLVQLGVAWQDVQGVLLTHLHSDHVVGFPDLWLTGWLIVPGRTVPLSVWGPTGTGRMMSHNLIRHARGVDVLVHEVFVPETLSRAGVPPERAKRIIDYHLTPEQAGEVFTRVTPRLAVYSHICMPNALDDDILPATRRTYSGPLELGEDLMVIDVGDQIAVRRPTGAQR